MEHRDRFIPADNNAGWPIAGLVVGLALACIAAVAYIHNKTYKHPTDVTWNTGASSGHAAPAPAATKAH
jgi:hypothetical protein